MSLRHSVCRVAVEMFVLSLGLSIAGHGLENGLAKTPPMGWNSWNKYGCTKINEKVVRDAADAMASSGMKDAGYQYVVIDDCWQTERDAAGNIVADSERFPAGMKALADYVHSKGLKFGVYTDGGTKTCAGRPGSLGHEFQDAKQYASWGVDYLKEDWCYTLPTQNSESSYTLMRDALAASGRPIVLSICEWGSTKPWLWAKQVGNLWRATGDIQDCWACTTTWGATGVIQIIDQMDGLESYAGPGHWNDPDILEVGNGGMSLDEDGAHFSMWALFSAPLLAGNDLGNMSTETKRILLNKEVIAVDQDALGQQGRRIRKSGDLEVWSKQLADGSRAVVLLNRSLAPASIEVFWTDLGYPAGLAATVRNLWTGKEIRAQKGSYSEQVSGHGAVMVTVRP